MKNLEPLIRGMIERQASDLHIQTGDRPYYRVDGQLVPLDGPLLSSDEWEGEFRTLLSQEQQRQFETEGDVDFAFRETSGARLRGSCFKQRQGVGAAFRLLGERARTLEELGLPHLLERFAHLRSGLVLFAGATGSGKTTSLAAIVSIINRTYRKHIISVEEPIEFVMENKLSLIHQRGLGYDCLSFAQGIRDSLRQSPDVLVIGELRELGEIREAVSAAETGVLVFATIHADNVQRAMERVIDAFPSEEQSQARTMLSHSLEAVVAQMLFPRREGGGVVPACEILIGSPALAGLIREDKIYEVLSLLQTGRAQGMRTFEDDVLELVAKGRVDRTEVRTFLQHQNRKY